MTSTAETLTVVESEMRSWVQFAGLDPTYKGMHGNIAYNSKDVAAALLQIVQRHTASPAAQDCEFLLGRATADLDGTKWVSVGSTMSALVEPVQTKTIRWELLSEHLDVCDPSDEVD